MPALLNLATLFTCAGSAVRLVATAGIRAVRISLSLVCAMAGTVHADIVDDMRLRYGEYRDTVSQTSLPFVLESREEGKTISAQISTFMQGIAFRSFAERLSDASQWCEFIPLHLNVKACRHGYRDGREMLGFFLGPKRYRTPEKSSLLELQFETEVSDELLEVVLFAAKGPYRSRNHDYRLRAIGTDDGVYMEFDLSSEPGWVSSLARIYLATVGLRKTGFSVDRLDLQTGKAVHVRGRRGGIERNIVRYLFSIQAYFDTLDQEHRPDIHLQRLERWFELSARHPQLYEMPKDAYIEIKTRERHNQLLLRSTSPNATSQSAADSGCYMSSSGR